MFLGRYTGSTQPVYKGENMKRVRKSGYDQFERKATERRARMASGLPSAEDREEGYVNDVMQRFADDVLSPLSGIFEASLRRGHSDAQKLAGELHSYIQQRVTPNYLQKALRS